MNRYKFKLSLFLLLISICFYAQAQKQDVSLLAATNVPTWAQVGTVKLRRLGNRIDNIDVPLFVDTALIGSTKRPFAATLLLDSNEYLFVDDSPLRGANSIQVDLAIDCAAEDVKHIKAQVFSDRMSRGQILGAYNGEFLFKNISINSETLRGRLQGASDAKELAKRYYCRRADDEEKKINEAEAKRKFLETPEGKKYLAEEAEKANKKQRENQRAEANEKVQLAQEFPLYALVTCSIYSRHTSIYPCFSGDVDTEIELRNGNQYGLYKSYQFNSIGKDTSEGFVIDLRRNYQLKVQNSSSDLILGVKIINRSNNAVLFEKQVSKFKVINVRN